MTSLLVTGGGKGITAECTWGWPPATGAKLAISGPVRSGGATLAWRRTSARLEAAGVKCAYFRADVASAEQVAADGG